MNLLLFVLIGIPVLEVMILVKAGEAWGFWNTLLALVVMGAAGGILARFEGFRAMTRLNEALTRREMPAEHMLDAALIFVAGILLAVPGFFTDVLALFLLVPWTRYVFKRWLRRRFDRAMRSPGASSSGFQYRFMIR